LEGERTSYAAGQEDLFFVTFGADAFRAMSLDMNPEGLSLLLDNFETHENRVAALATVGISTETSITLQYLAYRQALERLPSLLPDWDLQDVIVRGSEALSHFEALSDNTTLISFDLSNYSGTVLWDTFIGLASDYDSSHDLTTAVTSYTENLTIIASHLAAIADSWDALAQALRAALSGNPLDAMLPVASALTVMVVVAVAVVILRRRR
jgi:hypothetical protein